VSGGGTVPCVCGLCDRSMCDRAAVLLWRLTCTHPPPPPPPSPPSPPPLACSAPPSVCVPLCTADTCDRPLFSVMCGLSAVIVLPRAVKNPMRFLNKTCVLGRKTRRAAVERGQRQLRMTQPSGLGIYLQHGEPPLATEDLSCWRAEMRSYIAGPDDPTANHWLFGPLALAARLSVDKQLDGVGRPVRRRPARPPAVCTCGG
jgi:hypothetical protein